MNITCHYYYFVEPLVEEYRDDNQATPPIDRIFVHSPARTYEVAFFGTANRIFMFRISLPNLAAEELAAADLNMAQVLKEHAIATLRLAYDHAVQVVHFQPWSYEHLGTPYRFQLGAKQFFRQDLNVNYDNLRGTFINGWPVRYEVQLLADSMNPNVPLQFRYLSLYKILELRFKTKGRWRLADYERFLERFRGEYARLGVSKMSPRRYIEQLRNRCVHIRSNRDVLGVTMLSNKDAAEVQNALPLVTAMCAEAINRDDRVKGFRLMRSSVDPKDSNLGSAD